MKYEVQRKAAYSKTNAPQADGLIPMDAAGDDRAAIIIENDKVACSPIFPDKELRAPERHAITIWQLRRKTFNEKPRLDIRLGRDPTDEALE